MGYIVLPYYILPRTKTKRRVFRKLKEKVGSENFNQSLQSYLGYLKHAKSYKIQQELKNEVWFLNLIQDREEEWIRLRSPFSFR